MMHLAWLLFSTQLFATVNLDPQVVIDRLLAQGPEAQQIVYQSKRAELPYYEALSFFDTGMEIKTNYEIDQSESVMGTSNVEDRSLGSSVKIRKRFKSGTHLSAQYGRLEQNSILSTFTSSLRPDQQNQSALYVELKQNLLNNAFGKKDRNQLKVAKLQMQEAKLSRDEELEQLILQTLALYWDTYVTKQSLEEAIEARKLIGDLVNTVKKKSRMGYAAPGELARVQAEFEMQDQRVKKLSSNYLTLLSSLKVKLKLDEDVELEKVSKLPEVPNKSEVELESQRFIKIARSRIETSKLMLSTAQNSALPVLDLDFSWSSIGVEQSADKAFTEMTSVTKPNYFVGLTLQFYLDSSSQGAAIADKKIRLQDSELSYNFLKSQLKTEVDNKYNFLSSSFKIVESTKKMLDHRLKALKQMKTAYNQGRLDIDILIQAYRDQFSAQVAHIEAIAQYYVNLHDYAASKDELISDKQLERQKL